jgi:ATP-dependent Clp protease ATP-binding subunit ClpA
VACEHPQGQDRHRPKDIERVLSKITNIPETSWRRHEGQTLHVHRKRASQYRQRPGRGHRARRQRDQKSAVGLRDARKPISSFIFLGPTGVGKTELAKTLAKFMFGTEETLIRVD